MVQIKIAAVFLLFSAAAITPAVSLPIGIKDSTTLTAQGPPGSLSPSSPSQSRDSTGSQPPPQSPEPQPQPHDAHHDSQSQSQPPMVLSSEQSAPPPQVPAPATGKRKLEDRSRSQSRQEHDDKEGSTATPDARPTKKLRQQTNPSASQPGPSSSTANQSKVTRPGPQTRSMTRRKGPKK